MSPKETLLYRITELMFEKQQTFLLLDELYEDEVISPFVRNIQIDSPYQQLVFDGVLSQYNHQNEIVVSFTIEAYFHHLLALVLQKDERYQSAESLLELIQNNNLSGIKEGVSNLLSFDVEVFNLKRLTDFIDLNEEGCETLNLSVMPLFSSLMINGVKETLTKLLDNPTNNDWITILKLNDSLDVLEKHVLRILLLNELMPLNDFSTKAAFELGLKACSILNKEQVQRYLSEIDMHIELYKDNENILNNYGNVFETIGQYDKALVFYQKCLNIRLKTLGKEHPDIALSFNSIGALWAVKKGDYYKAFEYYQKSLDIFLKNFGEEDLRTAAVYNNIAGCVSDNALEYYQKSLDAHLKTLGQVHTIVATLYNNIGTYWRDKGNFNKAIEYYQNSLDIRLKTFGEEHPDVAWLYNDFGALLEGKGDYVKALEYYQKSFDIRVKTLGEYHQDLAVSCFYIGSCFQKQKRYLCAIEFFNKGFSIDPHWVLLLSISECMEEMGNKNGALKYIIQSVDIQKKDSEEETIKESINNAKRLAKQLNKENELPEWIKNYKTE
jgi:tetratricopeptide (TPR) repeat protein